MCDVIYERPQRATSTSYSSALFSIVIKIQSTMRRLSQMMATTRLIVGCNPLGIRSRRGTDTFSEDAHDWRLMKRNEVRYYAYQP